MGNGMTLVALLATYESAPYTTKLVNSPAEIGISGGMPRHVTKLCCLTCACCSHETAAIGTTSSLNIINFFFNQAHKAH